MNEDNRAPSTTIVDALRNYDIVSVMWSARIASDKNRLRSGMSRNVLYCLRADAAALVVVILLTAGCTEVTPNPTAESAPVHPEILLVLPGAEAVNYTNDYDGSVSYRLTERHPADGTIKEIRSRLERQGWKPVADDLMNPGMTNSHERGWMNYIDGTRGDANVFLWSAAWESPRGDRVEYWLRYEYAKDSGPMSAKPPLQLTALYMTAPTVNIIREDVRRRGTPQPPKP